MTTFGPTRKDIHRLIGTARLSRYRQTAGGDRALAFELYKWNVRVCSGFLESIHYFEIAFRNTIHDTLSELQQKLDPGGDPWYRSALFPLAGRGPQIVKVACRRATSDFSIPEVEGRVVAELTFGFWNGLLASGYNRLLWQPGLATAFPQAKRTHLHTWVTNLVALRNRIRHHEPILNRDLHHDYQMLIATSEYVSPRLGWWIDSTSRIPDLLGERPRVKNA